MATELTVQSERAFQKQPHIFLNHKSKAKSTKVGKGGRRWYKDVGLGFRTPKTAIEGNYIGMSIWALAGEGEYISGLGACFELGLLVQNRGLQADFEYHICDDGREE
jgi:hypothetical protein